MIVTVTFATETTSRRQNLKGPQGEEIKRSPTRKKLKL
jgi:hypothetical protein